MRCASKQQLANEYLAGLRLLLERFVAGDAQAGSRFLALAQTLLQFDRRNVWLRPCQSLVAGLNAQHATAEASLALGVIQYVDTLVNLRRATGDLRAMHVVCFEEGVAYFVVDLRHHIVHRQALDFEELRLAARELLVHAVDRKFCGAPEHLRLCAATRPAARSFAAAFAALEQNFAALSAAGCEHMLVEALSVGALVHSAADVRALVQKIALRNFERVGELAALQPAAQPSVSESWLQFWLRCARTLLASASQLQDQAAVCCVTVYNVLLDCKLALFLEAFEGAMSEVFSASEFSHRKFVDSHAACELEKFLQFLRAVVKDAALRRIYDCGARDRKLGQLACELGPAFHRLLINAPPGWAAANEVESLAIALLDCQFAA